MNFITTTDTLISFCKKLNKQKFITIDLEFLREHTYYAKLCLIQVGSKEECAVIDPLSDSIDLSVFFEILQNPEITKVFHSGRQDIEILYYLTKKIPTPIFDTQTAAMVLGFGDSISYENLVRHLLGISLDKTCRLSDWSKRPLSESQQNYALSDVTHLVPLYEKLQKQLKKLNRTDWIKEEMQILCAPSTYDINPLEAWQRIHHRSHNARFLTVLRELAAWREERSQRRNTPRQSYIKDDMLMQIATARPHSVEELLHVRGIRKDIASGKLGTEIVEVINRCDNIPECEYVIPPKEKPLPNDRPALIELLKLLLKIKSIQTGVVARLITDDDELLKFSMNHDSDLLMLQGWRREIFGQDAIDLRDGKLSVFYNPDSRKIEFHSLKTQE